MYYEDSQLQQQQRLNSPTTEGDGGDDHDHPMIISDEDDREEETSYGEIEAELQQALESMQQEQHLRKSTSGRQLSSAEAPSKGSRTFFEKVERSLLFLGSRGRGGGRGGGDTEAKNGAKRKPKGGSLSPSLNRSSSMSFFGRASRSGSGSGNGDSAEKPAVSGKTVRSNTGGHNSKKSSAGGSRVSLTSEKRPPKLASKMQNTKM